MILHLKNLSLIFFTTLFFITSSAHAAHTPKVQKLIEIPYHQELKVQAEALVEQANALNEKIENIRKKIVSPKELSPEQLTLPATERFLLDEKELPKTSVEQLFLRMQLALVEAEQLSCIEQCLKIQSQMASSEEICTDFLTKASHAGRSKEERLGYANRLDILIQKAAHPPLRIKSCATCNKLDVNLQACSRCLTIFYCNVTCQKSDWVKHKPSCRAKPLPTA